MYNRTGALHEFKVKKLSINHQYRKKGIMVRLGREGGRERGMIGLDWRGRIHYIHSSLLTSFPPSLRPFQHPFETIAFCVL